MVGAGFVGTTFGDRLRPHHHEMGAGTALALVTADFSGRFIFNDMFANWIIGTAVKNAVAAVLGRHRAPAADWTFNSGVALAIGFRISLDVPAFRIVRTGNK